MRKVYFNSKVRLPIFNIIMSINKNIFSFKPAYFLAFFQMFQTYALHFQKLYAMVYDRRREHGKLVWEYGANEHTGRTCEDEEDGGILPCEKAYI